jgi:opacity protein-like surface antigen
MREAVHRSNRHQLLPYFRRGVAGGLAVLGMKSNFTPAPGLTCGTYLIVNCSGTNKQLGGVVGAGIEYGITQNVSAKLEYLYITAVSLDISHHSEIRAGLNYRFGGL